MKRQKGKQGHKARPNAATALNLIDNNTLAVLAVFLIVFSLFTPVLLLNRIYVFNSIVHKDRVTGNAVNIGHVMLHIIPYASTLQYFNITMESGMNWVSVPVYLTDDNISAALGSLGRGAGTGNDVFAGMAGCTGNASDDFVGNYTVVWAYNASDTADHWKSYTPTKPCFAIPGEDLKTMRYYWNYQIMMNSSGFFVNNGTPILNVSIQLENGMNWVGFPRTSRRAVNMSFNSLGRGAGTGNDVFAGMAGCTGNASDDFVGNYTVVWAYNASDTADHWKSYTPTKPCFAIPNEDLQYLTPGSGYQIMMNASGVWVVDW